MHICDGQDQQQRREPQRRRAIRGRSTMRGTIEYRWHRVRAKETTPAPGKRRARSQLREVEPRSSHSDRVHPPDHTLDGEGSSNSGTMSDGCDGGDIGDCGDGCNRTSSSDLKAAVQKVLSLFKSVNRNFISALPAISTIQFAILLTSVEFHTKDASFAQPRDVSSCCCTVATDIHREPPPPESVPLASRHQTSCRTSTRVATSSTM